MRNYEDKFPSRRTEGMMRELEAIGVQIDNVMEHIKMIGAEFGESIPNDGLLSIAEAIQEACSNFLMCESEEIREEGWDVPPMEWREYRALSKEWNAKRIANGSYKPLPNPAMAAIKVQTLLEETRHDADC